MSPAFTALQHTRNDEDSEALLSLQDAIKGLMPGSVIELEGEAIWLNGPFGSNALFVRKVYPELIAARDDLVQERGWPQSDFETVFTGTPGTRHGSNMLTAGPAKAILLCYAR